MPQNPLILVTGGASGIGEATCRRFAATGKRIIVADRRGEAAESVASDIGGFAASFDISKEQAVAEAVDRIERDHGPIGILVNCAGPLQNMELPETLPMAMWDRITDSHLRGTYCVTVAVGSRMAARGSGVIVTVASVVGIASGPLHAYGPAKAALINLCRGLAVEWGRAGVRINSVSPGFVRTPGTERGYAEGLMDPDIQADSTAIGRLLSADEIAAAICFLASDDASGITGIDLPVDAGYLAATPWNVYGERRPK